MYLFVDPLSVPYAPLAVENDVLVGFRRRGPEPRQERGHLHLLRRGLAAVGPGSTTTNGSSGQSESRASTHRLLDMKKRVPGADGALRRRVRLGGAVLATEVDHLQAQLGPTLGRVQRLV